MRWLERYLVESSPRLQHFAEITASLAKVEPLDSLTATGARGLPADRGARAGGRRAELATRVGTKLMRNRARLHVEGGVPGEEPLHLGEVALLRSRDQSG